MKAGKTWRDAGLWLGLAAFVAVAVFFTISPGRGTAARSSAPPPPPLQSNVVAPAQQLGRAYAAVAARIKPAVVSIYCERMVLVAVPQSAVRLGRGAPKPQQKLHRVQELGLGSGMILDGTGDILTNDHVVRGFSRIRVRLADGRKFPARIVGTDPRSDVAIIRIEGSVPTDLPTVRLGDSAAIRAGDLVLAVGAPYGLIQTVTNGIISAKGRSDLDRSDEDYLQTDAPINPGNSGGPLVDMQGQVIGMNTAILTTRATADGAGQFGGVAFAIPIDRIKTILPTLLRGGQVTRGMLGVVMRATDDLAKLFESSTRGGALVYRVTPGSPAARAGLRRGDDIVRFGAHRIGNSRDLRILVAATAPGTQVAVEVIRDGRPQTFTVTIGKLRGLTRRTIS